MNIIVMKFGGTSVGNISKIKNVAKIVAKEIKKYKIIVVLSAMGGVTNKLQKYIEEIRSKKTQDIQLEMPNIGAFRTLTENPKSFWNGDWIE